MVMRHMEGFEAVADDVRMARFYDVVTGGQLSTNDNAMHFGDAGTSGAVLLRTRQFPSVQNTWVIGCGFRPDNTIELEDPDNAYIALRNAAGEQIRMEFFENDATPTKPGGNYYGVRVVRGATVLASSIERFDVSVGTDEDYGWIYFEFKVTIDNASGSFEVRYHSRRAQNGQQTITWDSASSGVDTQEQGTTGADQFELNFDTGNVSRAVSFCDVYVLDSTGAVNNDFLGRTAVIAMKPDSPAEGDTDDWTLTGGSLNLNDAWDEGTIGGDDDKRNTSKVTNEVSLCVVPALDFLRLATIHAVVQHLSVKMETTGSLTLHHRWRKTTGTPAEVDGTSVVVSTTAWVGDSDLRDVDPNTAVAFVIADLDAYQHGVRNGG